MRRSMFRLKNQNYHGGKIPLKNILSYYNTNYTYSIPKLKHQNKLGGNKQHIYFSYFGTQKWKDSFILTILKLKIK